MLAMSRHSQDVLQQCWQKQSLMVVHDVPQLELSQVLWMSNLLENDSKMQKGCLRDTRGADGRNEAPRPATEGLLKILSDPRQRLSMKRCQMSWDSKDESLSSVSDSFTFLYRALRELWDQLDPFWHLRYKLSFFLSGRQCIITLLYKPMQHSAAAVKVTQNSDNNSTQKTQ